MKRTAAALAIVCMLTAAAFASCAGSATEISYYSGTQTDANGKIVFNEELFFVNENKGTGPDPFVLDDTSRSGYYYIGSTLGEFVLYRSKDMMTMEAVGPSLSLPQNSAVANAASSNRWAPEYLYDEDDGYYYMFFSATPKSNGSYSAGAGVVRGKGDKMPYIARSKTPEGPYEMIDFTSEEAVEGGWAHDLNAAGGTRMTLEDVEQGVWGVNDDGVPVEATERNYTELWKPSYPQLYAKYAYLDPTMFMSAGMSIGKTNALTNGGYSNGIDLHPYLDPVTGEKYLFLTMNEGYNFLVGLKMFVEEDGSSSWLKPDWSTFTIVTVPGYWTLEDYENGVHANENGDPCYDSNTDINEGATVIEHGGKYYLTFSINSYQDNSYEVCQAIADSPLGPYRKLREEENGRMLSGALEGSEEMSGTGHHSILTIGDQMYIYYHSHNSYVAMGAARHGNIDELEWVSILDYEGNPLDVLVVNGATATLQPRIAAHAEYHNVAEDATITIGSASSLAEGSSLQWLNDGLLSVCKNGSPAFYDVYVQETRITETATFEITLASARAVRAVMVYNSKLEAETFLIVSRMEFIAEGGAKYYLADVAFPTAYYSQSQVTGNVTYVSPGAAAFAEFYELQNIKTIRITVEVPAGQDAVGISEIRVLGK